MRKPDFDNNIKKILQKQCPSVPTPFEFIISPQAEELLSGYTANQNDIIDILRRRIKAFYTAGYDYVPIIASGFHFTRHNHIGAESYSLNEGSFVSDREAFEKYKWLNPSDYHYDIVDTLAKELPDGMKFMIYGNDGILENVIGIVGYDNLCYMLADDYSLAEKIFMNVGTRLVDYYKGIVSHKSVGMLFYNDDWGFNSGTMISHSDLKAFLYPHVRNITTAAHKNGKPCAMHSCGNFRGMFSDFYTELGISGKHSYEDNILPVEKAYELFHKDIAILGGMDIDFLCRSDEATIQKRCYKMLETSQSDGSYALGSGNSIARYIPLKNYIAMLKCTNPDLKLPNARGN